MVFGNGENFCNCRQTSKWWRINVTWNDEFSIFSRVRVAVNERKDKSVSLNKSWIVQWRERFIWNYCTVIRGFTWEVKTINAQTLGNNNVSNSYLQKLVLCYLKGGGGKSFSEELLQFEKHETGWKFLANLHTKNRFPSKKILSRKGHKTYNNSFVSICQVDDDIMMITIKFPILWSLFMTRG